MELWALREKFAAAELTELRGIGRREYLVIQPLAPQRPNLWRLRQPRPSKSSMNSGS
jgi:hypothetical protein